MAATYERDQLVDLPRIEQSLLWAIRTWVLGRQSGEDMSFKIESVFRHIGAAGTAIALEGFLWVLSHGLTRTLQVHCTCQLTVSQDEAHLLQVFCLLGDDRVEDAELLLRSFAIERVAVLASECARRVALELEAAGYRLGQVSHGQPQSARRLASLLSGSQGFLH